jgi:hypothetical protein
LILTAGNGLTGGGNLTADRAFAVQATATKGVTVTAGGVELDIAGMGVLPEAVDATNDKVPIYNQSETRPRYVSPATLLAGASGFVTTGRLITSGAGLTGGGDLSADRTLAVGAGTGILVNADDVALDTAHVRNVDHAAVSITAGVGLSGGGTIAANRTISLDTTSTRNVDHSAVAITAGTGLTGGGDISASRTIGINTSVVPQLTAASNIFRGIVYGGVDGTNGYCSLQAGNANTVGLVAFFTPDAVNRGYLGLGGGSVMALVGLNGYVWDLFSSSGATVPWSKITGTKNADQLQGYVLGEAGSASSIPYQDSSGFLRARVIYNPGGVSSDGLYLGYNNAGGAPALTRIYGGGSTSANVTVDASGNLVASGNVSAFSDERLKKDVRTILYALDIVEKLRGVRYTDKRDETSHIGVIAQEMEPYIPEVVTESEDGYKTVQYGNLVAVLIEAVKELSYKVRALEAK